MYPLPEHFLAKHHTTSTDIRFAGLIGAVGFLLSVLVIFAEGTRFEFLVDSFLLGVEAWSVSLVLVYIISHQFSDLKVFTVIRGLLNSEPAVRPLIIFYLGVALDLLFTFIERLRNALDNVDKEGLVLLQLSANLLKSRLFNGACCLLRVLFVPSIAGPISPV